MDKKIFRKECIAKRNGTPINEIISKSADISNKFLSSEQYKNAKKIFTYVNYGSEIVTKPIIENALQNGKETAVPYITKEKGIMVFIKINSLDELLPNKFKIPEPQYNEKNISVPTADTVVIVPLLAYNSEKYRIGYGGGYYDRYIQKYPRPLYIGFGMDFQETPNLPVEDFDKKLDLIITNNKVF